MSAKGRKKESQPYDFYPTPRWVVRRLLESVKLPGGLWLEPCAGEGSIIRAVNDVRHDVTWMVNELRPECVPDLRLPGVEHVRTGDFLEWTPKSHYQVVITNPPFTLAQEIIDHCFQRVSADYVVMFTRINFLGSEKRSDWIYEYVPDVHVLPNRPSMGFNKDGKKGVDATEYCWMIWPNVERETGTITILKKTSVEEREDGWQETLRILGVPATKGEPDEATTDTQ